MLIIKAEAPAGLTIEQAVEEALDLAYRTGCMVKMELNDIPMLFSESTVFGKTHQERVKYFSEEFRRRLSESYERR